MGKKWINGWFIEKSNYTFFYGGGSVYRKGICSIPKGTSNDLSWTCSKQIFGNSHQRSNYCGTSIVFHPENVNDFIEGLKNMRKSGNSFVYEGIIEIKCGMNEGKRQFHQCPVRENAETMLESLDVRQELVLNDMKNQNSHETDRIVLAVVGPYIPGVFSHKGVVGDHIYTYNFFSRDGNMHWVDLFCGHDLRVPQKNENQEVKRGTFLHFNATSTTAYKHKSKCTGVPWLCDYGHSNLIQLGYLDIINGLRECLLAFNYNQRLNEVLQNMFDTSQKQNQQPNWHAKAPTS